MLLKMKHEDHLDLLAEQIHRAKTIGPDLMTDVMDRACVRFNTIRRTETAARLLRLIQAGAWTEAALDIVKLEQPLWKLRRLQYEDGQWFCALSKERNLPEQLDDSADGHHEVMPLAILSAFIEAYQRESGTQQIPSPTGPRVKPTTAQAITTQAMCCDNFA